MKENLIVLLVFLLLLGGGYGYYKTVIVPQPEQLKTLQSQIEEKNKQLLAAQILAEKREGVKQLIRNNLIQNPNDSLTERASVPFLRFLTGAIDRFGIRLVAITPMEVIGKDDPATLTQREYLQVPYELKVLASYEELGRFLDALEKSPHLIKVASFTVSNDIDQSSYAEEIAGKPKQHSVNIQINTIAILKASFRSESG
jgi:Tfp pilus assembly protein PilO